MEQILELHRGQGMEIYWRDNYMCPTEKEYSQMTIRSINQNLNIFNRNASNNFFYRNWWFIYVSN